MTSPYKINKITALASTAASYQDSLKVYKSGMLPFGKTDESSSGGDRYTGPIIPRMPIEVYGLISPDRSSVVTVLHSPNTPLNTKNLTSVNTPTLIEVVIAPSASSDVVVKHSPNSPSAVESLSDPISSGLPVVEHSPNSVTSISIESSPSSSSNPDVKFSPGSVTNVDILFSPNRLALIELEASPFSVSIVDYGYIPNELDSVSLEISPASVSEVDNISNPSVPTIIGIQSSPNSVRQVATVSSPVEFDQNILVEHNPNTPVSVSRALGPSRLSLVDVYHSPNPPEILIENTPNAPSAVGNNPSDVLEVNVLISSAGVSDITIEHSPNSVSYIASVNLDAKQVGQVSVEHSPNSPISIDQDSEPFTVSLVSTGVFPEEVSIVSLAKSPQTVSEVSLSRSPETPSLSIEFSPNSVSECLTGIDPVPADDYIDVQHSPNKPSSVITEADPNLVSDITVQHTPNELISTDIEHTPGTPSLSIEFSPNSVSECLTGIDPVPADDYIDVQHSPNKPSSVITGAYPNLVSDITVQHTPNELISTDIEHTPNNPISIITESEVYEVSDIEVLHSPNGLSNVSIDKSPCQPCDVEAQHEPNPVAFVGFSGQPNMVDTVSIDYQPNPVSEVGYGFSPEAVSFVSAGFLYTEAPSDLSDITISHTPNQVISVLSIDATLPDEVQEITVSKDPEIVGTVSVNSTPNTVSSVSLLGQSVPDDIDLVSVAYSANSVSTVSTLATPNKVSTIEAIKQDLDGDGVPDDEEYFVYEPSVLYTKENLDSFELSYSTFELTGGDIIKWIAPNDGILTTGEYYMIMMPSSTSAVVESGPVNPATNTPDSKTIFYTDKGTKFLKVNQGVVATAPNDPLSPTILSSPTKVLEVSTANSPYRPLDLSIKNSPKTLSNVESVELTEWTPEFSTSIEGWWDASDASSITTSGTEVTQWRDKSGNSLHLAPVSGETGPATNSIQQNSLNVLDFNGDCLENTTFSHDISSAFYVAFLLELDSLVESQYFFWAGTDNGTNRCAIRKRSNGQVEVFGKTSSGANTFLGFGAPTRGTFNILVAKIHGSNGAAYFNGSQTNTGNSGASNLNTFNLGHAEGETQNFTGKFAEVVAFTDGNDLQKIEGYMAHKWALTGNLPSGHPYKSSGPKL
jgi:hypothetical protein